MQPEHIMHVVDDLMSKRWVWGFSDCCISASDVFDNLHGIDPMSVVRGTYDTARKAYRLTQQWGGLFEMSKKLAELSNLQISSGDVGDIGISYKGVAMGPEGRALLICIQPGAWAGKTENGYAIIPNAEICWRPKTAFDHNSNRINCVG